MKLFKVGDKSKALCWKCEKLSDTTFKTRSVPLSSGRGHVDNVLVSVCDTCNETVAVPQQSVPRIKEFIKPKRYSIEVRLPKHLMDALFLACEKVGVIPAQETQATFLRFYIHQASLEKEIIQQIKKTQDDDALEGKADERVSLKVSETLYREFEDILKRTDLSKTDFIKALILFATQEILNEKSKDRMNRVKEVLLSAA